MRSTTEPEISAGAMMANIAWKATYTGVGMVPTRLPGPVVFFIPRLVRLPIKLLPPAPKARV